MFDVVLGDVVEDVWVLLDDCKMWWAFDVVLMNLSFFEVMCGMLLKNKEKKGVWFGILEDGGVVMIYDFIGFVKEVLREDGEFFVVYFSFGRARLLVVMVVVFGDDVVCVMDVFDYEGVLWLSLVFVCVIL